MNAVKSFSSFPNGWSVAEAKAGTRYFEVQDVPIFEASLAPNRFNDLASTTVHLGRRRCRDVWSYDSIGTQTHDGRRIRLMTLIVVPNAWPYRLPVEAASRGAESEIVRMCALWESRDPAKENIPTVIELIDDATIIDMVSESRNSLRQASG